MDLDKHYILVDRKPVNKPLLEWAQWFETADRHVAETTIGVIRISTVFLGLDHSWGDGEEPILFETMIFGGDIDQYQNRCSTWEEAEQMHKDAVALVIQRMSL